MSLFQLFCTFFYIGLFTIGGGIVSLTLMQQTIVEQGLISEAQFYNMVAISESTPGPLGTNMATFIGYNMYGILGGFVATMGEVLPSLIIIMIIARFMTKMHENPLVKGSLAFLRPITTGLILVPVTQVFIYALVNVPANISVLASLDGWKSLFDWVNLPAYAVFTFLLFKFKLHPILLIVLGAIFGIFFL